MVPSFSLHQLFQGTYFCLTFFRIAIRQHTTWADRLRSSILKCVHQWTAQWRSSTHARSHLFGWSNWKRNFVCYLNVREGARQHRILPNVCRIVSCWGAANGDAGLEALPNSSRATPTLWCLSKGKILISQILIKQNAPLEFWRPGFLRAPYTRWGVYAQFATGSHYSNGLLREKRHAHNLFTDDACAVR